MPEHAKYCRGCLSAGRASVFAAFPQPQVAAGAVISGVALKRAMFSVGTVGILGCKTPNDILVAVARCKHKCGDTKSILCIGRDVVAQGVHFVAHGFKDGVLSRCGVVSDERQSLATPRDWQSAPTVRPDAVSGVAQRFGVLAAASKCATRCQRLILTILLLRMPPPSRHQVAIDVQVADLAQRLLHNAIESRLRRLRVEMLVAMLIAGCITTTNASRSFSVREDCQISVVDAESRRTTVVLRPSLEDLTSMM